MSTLPIIAGFVAERPFMWNGREWITQGRLVGAARALAAALPDARYALNLCADRYAFSVAFAATLLRGQASLLPGSPLPAVVAGLQERYPDSCVIDDAMVAAAGPGAAAGSLPQIEAAAIAAIAFTSGSTGLPQPHAKTFGSLTQAAQLIAQRLLDLPGQVQVLATVPSQHMFGLETTTLQALASGACVHHARPQFPDDLRAALEVLAAPRVLVTTPVHLRALCLAGTQLPPLARIVSATAPLPAELAADAEARYGAQVHEIYGCTEAGSIATRRTVEGARWRLLGGMRLSGTAATGLQVEGSHLPQPVPLQDVLEADGADGLRFVGRATDLVKVAGKRASAADLTLKLLSIPGVDDGVVFQPDGDDMLQRPAALVVAPRLSVAEILEQFGRLVDPVFLPRPLRKVERLPRNELGKLPRARLLEILGDG